MGHRQHHAVRNVRFVMRPIRFKDNGAVAQQEPEEGRSPGRQRLRGRALRLGTNAEAAISRSPFSFRCGNTMLRFCGKNEMSNKLFGAALAVMCALQTSPAQALGPFCGKGDKSYVGSYEMRGVPEVGSQLRINRDGSFEFYLAYGANDQHGKGCWTQTDKLIALFPANSTKIAPDHTPDTRGFTGILLDKKGKELHWRISGSHLVGKYRR